MFPCAYTDRRVTRRANDDDTLISRGGRGSFFKGQPGRELLNAKKVEEQRRTRGGNKNKKTNTTTTTTTTTKMKKKKKKKKWKKKKKKKRFSPHAEANVRNDS